MWLDSIFQIYIYSKILFSSFLASRKKFFVQLAGKTNGAHQDFVTRLKGDHHTEVASFDNSDYLLIFCPVVSRVGTDIGEALEKIPGRKQFHNDQSKVYIQSLPGT